ncbi:hypothetical protein K7X08_030923 [Anisodus acutangulus]|uniref:Uncharacterized protein n=1 Tax=Anisodus acutangulus TaxID=402998 RepID=A0A9Q1RCK4_9SOLA|nr:hypothetical protein K7X08_030923 [Anisodus acutangulus]
MICCGIDKKLRYSQVAFAADLDSNNLSLLIEVYAKSTLLDLGQSLHALCMNTSHDSSRFVETNEVFTDAKCVAEEREWIGVFEIEERSNSVWNLGSSSTIEAKEVEKCLFYDSTIVIEFWDLAPLIIGVLIHDAGVENKFHGFLECNMLEEENIFEDENTIKWSAIKGGVYSQAKARTNDSLKEHVGFGHQFMCLTSDNTFVLVSHGSYCNSYCACSDWDTTPAWVSSADS